MGNIIPCTDFNRAVSVRRPKGVIIIDGIEVGQTRMCAHCGTHFLSVRGSGQERGFCTNCMGDTCGDKTCDPCVPYEKRIELYEKGKISKL